MWLVFHLKKNNPTSYPILQGVLIASIVIMVKPSWTIVDPICTVLFSILVMFTTYRLVWDSLGILMEGTPTHIDPEEIESGLLEIPGVVLVHDLHVWNLTAGKVTGESLFNKDLLYRKRKKERRRTNPSPSTSLHLTFFILIFLSPRWPSTCSWRPSVP